MEMFEVERLLNINNTLKSSICLMSANITISIEEQKMIQRLIRDKFVNIELEE